jgi:hypothetical protein
MAGRNVRQLVHPRVCPACGARSVDDCHCFCASIPAGYYETNWSSLVPVDGQFPPADEQFPPSHRAVEHAEAERLEQMEAEPKRVPDHVEELPTPDILLPSPPAAEKGAGRSSKSVGKRKPGVTHRGNQTSRSAGEPYPPVSFRIRAHSQKRPAPPTPIVD